MRSTSGTSKTMFIAFAQTSLLLLLYPLLLLLLYPLLLLLYPLLLRQSTANQLLSY